MSIKEILSTRKQRLSLQREVDLLEEKEKALTSSLIEKMVSQKISVLKEGEDEVTLNVSTEPLVTSWPLLLDYIVENNAVDLLQKRITVSAIKSRWAENIALPGVGSLPKHTIKFNV